MKFNMDEQVYNKLCEGVLDNNFSDNNSPIHENETLEPCVEGLDNIKNNPVLLQAVKEVMEAVISNESRI